eukprot:138850_1
MIMMNLEQFSLEQRRSLFELLSLEFIVEANPEGTTTFGAQNIGYDAVALCASLMLVSVLVCHFLHVGITKDLIVGTTRCVAQLSLVGYILVPVFKSSSPELVIGIALIMLTLAAFETRSRPKHFLDRHMLSVAWLSLTTASGVVLLFGLVAVFRVHPLWEPQYLIPTLGMLLGNSLNAVSLALNSCLSQLHSDKDIIESLIACGASRWETVREVGGKALQDSLMIVVNQLNVTGVVAIPGMMTGQILSGTDPDLAARYQIVIWLLIATTCVFAAALAVILTIYQVVDSATRVRANAINTRTSKHADLVIRSIRTIWTCLVKVFCCCIKRNEHEVGYAELGDS